MEVNRNFIIVVLSILIIVFDLILINYNGGDMGATSSRGVNASKLAVGLLGAINF